MSVFTEPVFEGAVTVEGKEFFKGQGAARQRAQQVGNELGISVKPRKIGTGWALAGIVDGVETVWGIYGQRLMRIDTLPGSKKGDYVFLARSPLMNVRSWSA